jgi:membrane-associated phospholipid phosphatase
MFRSLIKSSPVLFFGLIIYISVFTVIILLFDKVTIFYFVNSRFNPFLDQLFYYVTALGNGWTYAIVLLAMLFVRYRYILMFFSAICIQTIIVQSMKYLIFPDILRPHAFFQSMSGFHVVNGVDLLNFNSFPSGHSASIFCAAVLLSLILKKNNWTILFILIAILTGYSRMYLGQHFSVDVYTGSIIGILSAYISSWFFVIKPSGKLNRISWIDKKLTFSKAA